MHKEAREAAQKVWDEAATKLLFPDAIAEIITDCYAEREKELVDALTRLLGACRFVDEAEISISTAQWNGRIRAAENVLAKYEKP